MYGLRAILLCFYGALALWIAPGLAGGTQHNLIDHPMNEDPALLRQGPEHVVHFDPRVKSLWLQALDAPDANTRRLSAVALGEAHALGVGGLEAAVPKLTARLDDPHPQVRLAAAAALLKFDARSAAPMLLMLNQAGDLDMIVVTDPALAKWQVRQALHLWRARVADPGARRSIRLSAITALVTIKDPAAQGLFRKLALDRSADASLRVAAARALSRLTSAGLEADANELLAHAGSLGDRLVAASMLARHAGDHAKTILVRLAQDSEPAVAAIAIARLLEADPPQLRPLIDRLIQNADAKVRHLAARTLVEYATPHAIVTLAPLLDDRSPQVRRCVRDGLIELNKNPSLAAAISRGATRLLAGAGWRGQEQAALVLGKHGQNSAAPRLIQIITGGDRHEARLAAIAALRWLAMEPTMPALMTHAQTLMQESESYHVGLKQNARKSRLPKLTPQQVWLRKKKRQDAENRGHELAQVAQTFGVMDYRPADRLLRKMVPKGAPYFPGARAAAVWTLGKLHASGQDAALASLFAQRLADAGIPGAPGEDLPVRYACAIALGRMNAKAHLSVLRTFHHAVAPACRWAIEQITNETMPPHTPSQIVLDKGRRFLRAIGRANQVEIIVVEDDAAP